MASVRKRKMARSSISKNTRRDKEKKRNLKYIPHPVMAAHWDKSLTWKQNYERFGLQSNLGKSGSSFSSSNLKSKSRTALEETLNVNPETVANETDPAKIPLGEARLIRNPETNEVIEIIYGKMESAQEENQQESVPILEELKEYQLKHAKPARKQTVSEIECHWLAALHEKYGDNYEKMKWDKALNPMFLSVGQLKKKMEVWKKLHSDDDESDV